MGAATTEANLRGGDCAKSRSVRARWDAPRLVAACAVALLVGCTAAGPSVSGPEVDAVEVDAASPPSDALLDTSPESTGDAGPPDAVEPRSILDGPNDGCRVCAPAPVASPASLVAYGDLRLSALSPSKMGARCLVVEDLDGDGALDLLYTTHGQPPNTTATIVWGPMTKDSDQSTVEIPVGSYSIWSCTAFDIDDDGDLDILIGSTSSILSLRTVAPRTYVATTDVVEFNPSAPLVPIRFIMPLDLDGKPPLDIVAGGSGEFIDCFAFSHPSDPGHGENVFLKPLFELVGWSACSIADGKGEFWRDENRPCAASANGQWLVSHQSDFNLDGRPEVLLGEDFGTNALFVSEKGRWVESAATAGLAEPTHTMGIATADFDGDGRNDIYMTDVGPDRLHLQSTCRTFEDASLISGVAVATDRTISWGIGAGDIDHNGAVDLFVSNSLVAAPGAFVTPANTETASCYWPERAPIQFHSLLMNRGDATFAATEIPHLPGYRADWDQINVATGDLDADGDLDFVVVEHDQPVAIYWNDVPKAGRWLQVVARDLRGRPVLGATVVVRHAGGGERFRELTGQYAVSGHSAIRAHFGLGDDPAPVVVEVRWPHGAVTTVSGVAVDQVLQVTADSANP